MATLVSWFRHALNEEHITPLTWRNAPVAHAYLPLYFTLAYLTRRPGSHRLRIVLLPVVIAVILRCTTGYRIQDELWGWYNWIRGTVQLTWAKASC